MVLYYCSEYSKTLFSWMLTGSNSMNIDEMLIVSTVDGKLSLISTTELMAGDLGGNMSYVTFVDTLEYVDTANITSKVIM